jgi:antitoxin MazE
MEMRSNVARWGNSLALRIPRALAEELALAEGAPVQVDVKEGELVVRPVRRREALDELLRRITPDNLPDERLDDGPRGRERI